MRYEIETYFKGTPHQSHILRVWLSPKDSGPRVHTGKSMGYISRTLASYKKIAKRLDTANQG